jgi:hypothetical protein
LDIICDKFGNEIYITDERWEHIYERHPEINGFEKYVLQTLRLGRRRQQPLEPDVYKYFAFYNDLPENNTEIIVVVKFGQRVMGYDQEKTNNFIITAYMK